MTLNQISAPLDFQTPGNQEDLVELGAMLTGAGLTTMESRALISTVQRIAELSTLGAVPQLLEHVRQINTARVLAMLNQIRALPTLGGYVSRDRVLQIVQNVYSTPPRS